MNELPIEGFQHAIAKAHGADSKYAGRATVREIFEGRAVGEGEVLIFSLRDHDSASTCYAWEVDGRVTAVLHEPPVDSTQAAVRAAIVAEQHGE